MDKWCLIFLIFLAFLHANARNLPSDLSGLNEQKNFHNLPNEQTFVHATAPAVAAESPSGSGLKDKKNFIFGGVGGFAGMGGYAGVVGGLPLLGGLGGIGKYGGIGGVGGIGGYSGIGTGGGLGGIGGLGGGAGGGAAAGAAGGAKGGDGIFPCP